MSTESEQSISCPECGATINVNEILAHKIRDDLKQQYESQMSAERKKNEDKAIQVEKQGRELKRQQELLQQSINDGVSKLLASEKAKLTSAIKKQLEDESSDQVKSMQAELAQKSEQLKDLNKTKAQLEKLKREKDELRESIEAESQLKLNEELKKEKARIEKTVTDKVQLKISEKENVIEQLRVQLQEAQRKAEQGSMQLQGEVQELAIEEWLSTSFPFDTITEVKKGARGADCVQIVNTATRENCGSIYYESKRTKDFQPSWIEKFKADLRSKGANIGVIVTEAMPKGMERLGLRDGIWVCSFDEFKGLCVVLRESIVKISDAVASQENKGEKMILLYDYLTSIQFKSQIEAIVEGFTQMHNDLSTERRVMESAWKKREKQIDKVLLNTNHMYSSIRGIAGSAVAAIPQLELTALEHLE